MADDLTIRNMHRYEVDELVEWAAMEGWNPGLHDADLFWQNDPDAFIAATVGGEMIGGGAITAYGDSFGFMGFFIVKPELRGRGLGNQLWHARLKRLRGRLAADATIGMDGVYEMQDYYARGGFEFSHRNVRFAMDVPHDYANALPASPQVIPLSDVDFSQLREYDRQCFPARRDRFLQHWVGQPDSLALGYSDGGDLAGYGVARRCREGCKIGPLFADSHDIARQLFRELAGFAAGGPLYLDAPETNQRAMALVREHRLVDVFGCARMYLGPFPHLAHDKIYGVTTFELG